jgi:radical SAM enzyme (TIGR01210 family)
MFETISCIEKYQKAKSSLLELHKKIKALIPENIDDVDFEQPGHHEIGVGSIDGKPIERVILILRGCGCEWANKKNGGCSMCGHLAGSSKGKDIPIEDLKKQFDTTMDQYDFRRYPMLCLYNGGSFLNEKEIPITLRRYLLRRIAAIPHIKRLIIESRLDYINDEILDEIESLLPDTTVEIGVGLETADDVIRDLVLNKGVTTSDLREMGKKFRDRKIKLLAYVLLNPPFLTESEAIADTIDTIRFAADIGADIVSIEAVSIQHLTLVSFLAEAGFYKTPWLWSIFEIVKQTHQQGLEIRIGGFEFFPIPKEFTSNCSICNEEMIYRIQEFNKTNDLSILQDLSCRDRCDLYWKRDLKKVNLLGLPERIIDTLESIDIPKILNSLNKKIKEPILDNNGMAVVKIKEPFQLTRGISE